MQNGRSLAGAMLASLDRASGTLVEARWRELSVDILSVYHLVVVANLPRFCLLGRLVSHRAGKTAGTAACAATIDKCPQSVFDTHVAARPGSCAGGGVD